MFSVHLRRKFCNLCSFSAKNLSVSVSNMKSGNCCDMLKMKKEIVVICITLPDGHWLVSMMNCRFKLSSDLYRLVKVRITNVVNIRKRYNMIHYRFTTHSLVKIWSRKGQGQEGLKGRDGVVFKTYWKSTVKSIFGWIEPTGVRKEITKRVE